MSELFGRLETEDSSLSVDFSMPFPYDPHPEKREDDGETLAGSSYAYLLWVKDNFKLKFNSLEASKKNILDQIFRTGKFCYFTPDLTTPATKFNVKIEDTKFQFSPRDEGNYPNGWWEGSLSLRQV